MIFPFLLVLLGIFFLCYALFLCRKMILVFDKPVHKRAGRIMFSMIIIFFFGYILYMIYNYPALFTDFLVSLLLLLSAFFIMLVLHVNHSLIIRLTMRTLELKDFSEKIWLQTESLKSSKQQLESIKALLEQKNKELESALQKLSAWGIEKAKSMVDKEAEQQKVEEAEKQKITEAEEPVKTFQA